MSYNYVLPYHDMARHGITVCCLFMTCVIVDCVPHCEEPHPSLVSCLMWNDMSLIRMFCLFQVSPQFGQSFAD